MRGGWDLIYCGHLNLTPLAVLLGAVFRTPVVLQIHGIDAWTPPPRRLAALLARRVDAVVSVSGFTLDRFLSWSKIPESRCFVIPCTYHEGAFAPGQKPDYLVRRYGIG